MKCGLIYRVEGSGGEVVYPIGFTLGNCEGLGHGATGPAVLTIWPLQIGAVHG